jgi:ketosteroid isomerase-like protein
MAVVWRHVASVGSNSDSIFEEGWESAYDSLAKEYATVSGGSHKPPTSERYGWIRQINIATDGTLACSAMHLRIPFKKDWKPQVVAFPELDVWRKFGNSWLAVQLHTYFPRDPATGRALSSYDLPDRGPMQWAADAVPGPVGDPHTTEAELRTWLATRTTVTDVDRLVRLFGPGDDVMAFGPTVPVEHRSLAEIRRYLVDSLRGVRSISAEVTHFKVQSDGLMSALLARQILTLQMADGSSRKMTIRNSNCLRKVGNEWRSMMEMVSYPSNVSSPLQ